MARISAFSRWILIHASSAKDISYQFSTVSSVQFRFSELLVCHEKELVPTY